MYDQSFWDKLYTETGSLPQSPYSKELFKKIIDCIPDTNLRILDAGCGGGALLSMLTKTGHANVQGIDLSPQGVKHIVENLQIPAQVGDLTNLSEVEDDSFDIVICSEVTEHLTRDQLKKAVPELCRIAKSRVIFTNPYKEDLRYYQFICPSCKSRFHPAGHIQSVDEHFITEYLDDTHCDVTFEYSGNRSWRTTVLSESILLFGYVILNSMEANCPICGSDVRNKRWPLWVRLAGNLQRMFGVVTSNFRRGRPANIVTIVEKMA